MRKNSFHLSYFVKGSVIVCLAVSMLFGWKSTVVYAATYRYPISISPRAPTSLQNVTVTVKSDPSDGEYGPALEYRIGGSSTKICPQEHSTCQSSGIGGSLSGLTTWTFIIPAQVHGTLVEYQLFNRDASGVEYGHTGYNWGYTVDDDVQTHHTIYIDGVIDFASNELVGSDGGVDYYFSWDSNNFYVLFDGRTTSSDRYNIGFDIDPGSTGGSGGCWGGSSFPLYGRPDHIIQYAGDNNSVVHAIPSGISNWDFGGSTTGLASSLSREGNIVEIKIPRELVGLMDPVSEVAVYLWVSYASGTAPYDCSTEEFTASYLPVENDTSGTITVTPIMAFYYGSINAGMDPKDDWKHQMNLTSAKAMTAAVNVQFHDVYVDSGSVFTGPNAGTIYVSGNWGGTGLFTHNSSVVVFNGNDAQWLSSSRTGTDKRFKHIHVVGSGGLTAKYGLDLTGDLIVSSSSGGFTAQGNVEFELSGSKILDCDAACNFKGDLVVRTVDASGSLAAVDVDGDFSIPTSSSIFTAPPTMSVAGNFSNDGTFAAGSGNVTFDGTAAQNLDGISVTTFHNMIVADGSSLVLTTEPTVSGTLINNGTMQQTATVNNSSYAFLEIEDGGGLIKYRGVEITTSANLGSITVTVRGADTDLGEFCTTTGAMSPVYAKRCFSITTDNNALAMVRLYALNNADELNGIASVDLVVYHNTGGSNWAQLTSGGANGTVDSGTYAFAEGQVTSFSSFLLGDGSVPTAIRLKFFQAASPGSMSTVYWIISVFIVSLLGVLKLANARGFWR